MFKVIVERLTHIQNIHLIKWIEPPSDNRQLYERL